MNVFREKLRANDSAPSFSWQMREQSKWKGPRRGGRRTREWMSGAINLQGIDNAVCTAKRALYPRLSFVLAARGGAARGDDEQQGAYGAAAQERRLLFSRLRFES